MSTEDEKTPEQSWEMEKAAKLQKLGEILDRLHNKDSVVEIAEHRLKNEIVPMMEQDELFSPGQKFGFEQLLDIDLEEVPSPYTIFPDSVWGDLTEDSKVAVVELVGDHFGLDLFDRESESFKEHASEPYEDEERVGVANEQVMTTTLSTNNPQIHILVHDYIQKDTGTKVDTQYSLMKV